MRALSVREPWATLIAQGKKTVELRSRRTRAIGERITICSTATRSGPGVTMCEATIAACRPATDADAAASCVEHVPAGWWAWKLEDVRPVEHRPVRGALGFWPLSRGLAE